VKSSYPLLSKYAVNRLLLGSAITVVLFCSFQRLCQVTAGHLGTPYDLEIESHNLATIRSLQEGNRIYDSRYYGHLPFIITIYNPFYHLLVAHLPQSKTNLFYAGRLVSLIATSLLLLLFFWPGHSNRFPKFWAASLLAISWALFIPTFLRSAVYLHPDMMALCFSALAVISLETFQRRSSIVLASLFGFLAFATKQSFVSATAASFLFLCFKDRQKAVFFFAVTALFYGAFFFLIPKYWGNGYWFSTFFSLLEHPAFRRLTLQRIGQLLCQPMFALLAASVAISLPYTAARDKSILTDSPYPIYLVISAIVPLLRLGKIGGEASYYLEFIVASLLWLVFFFRHFQFHLSGRYFNLFLLSFLLLLPAELSLSKPSSYLLTQHPNNRYFQNAIREKLEKEINDIHPENDHYLVLNTNVVCPFLKKVFSMTLTITGSCGTSASSI
jgi:hypothetical protein